MKPTLQTIVPPLNASLLVFEKKVRAMPFKWHRHPECELTWIVEGSGRRFVGDDISDYGHDDLVLLGSNIPHTWQTGPGERDSKARHRSVVVQFLPDFLGPESLNLPEFAGVLKLLTIAERGLKISGEAVSSITQRMTPMVKQPGLNQINLLLQILHILATDRTACRPIAGPAFQPGIRSGDEERMNRINGYVLSRLDKEIDAAEAARVAGMSTSSFSRYFKRLTGKTFVSYVNELRIGTACRQLVETDRQIAEIAFAAGYNNLSNFNRRFRETIRVPPTAYRRSFAGPDLLHPPASTRDARSRHHH